MSKLETILVELEESENYAIIYLNRPDQMNALNKQAAEEIYSVLEEISNNEKIRCVIITGKGKAFCAGGDLGAFKNAEEPDKFMVDMATMHHKMIIKLKNLKAPTIAAINGACFGGGLSLACACDFRVCSENAKFSVAFTRVGLAPDTSLTFHLPKIVGLPLANEMAIFNRMLNAEEAIKYNLVLKTTSKDSLIREVKELAAKISHGPTTAYASTLQLFNASYTNDLESQLNEEMSGIKINAASEDFQEGINSFFEKRKPNFKGR